MQTSCKLLKEICNKKEEYIPNLQNIQFKDSEIKKSNKSVKSTELKQKNESIFSYKENLINFINIINPELLENLEIRNFVKRGSVGTFYTGIVRKGVNKKVGLKFFLNERNNKLKRQSKIDEIKFLKKLHHKNIISLYKSLDLNNYNSLAILELAKYGDLNSFKRNIIKESIFSETFLCYLSKQLLEALDYIHRNKILHLDINPKNILIDRNLNIKLADFSISYSYLNEDENAKIYFPFAGTGKFIAPEILSKEKITVKDANKIDLYSFGTVLYYLAFDNFPYNISNCQSNNYNLILNTIRNETELHFPENIKTSNLFKDFLKRILERNIGKRFDIKMSLKHPWILGADIIFNEKEKISILEKFLRFLITDSISEFNCYLKSKDEKM